MADGGEESRADFSASDWEQVKDLVFTCQTAPPEDLDEWLRAHSQSEEVRREVARLLQASSACGSFMGLTASEKHLGVRLHQPLRIGRYRVMDQIGSGGSGVVYAAWDESLSRKVALKVLRPDVAQNPELQKRLRWDARAASSLKHPNIVVVYEVGTDAEVDYVAMECIAGQTLSHCIKAGGIDNREVLRYAIQICSGLEAAHAAGIVHRDLKPGNIMITEQGVVKILDFGLAKDCVGGFDSKDAPETVQGRFAGTVAYVSPEQAEAKSVDARSDIFSFGSVLFEMLTGRQAFPGGSSVSVLADILLTDPRPPHRLVHRVDPRFDELVGRCLRKDREHRFQSIAEVRVRLQELEDQILHPENQPAEDTPQARLPRWLAPAVVVSAIAIIALAATVIYLLFGRGHPPTRNFVLERITADRGVTGYPALSRDAKLLAYATDRAGDGNLDIWVQYLNGNDPRQLTTDPAGDYEPVFSPDGSHLVFRSDRDGGGLYTVSTLGGGERLLIPGGHGAQFSPDGKWIAYWKGGFGGSLQPGSVQIYIIPAVGGVPEQFQPAFQACAFPLWSPDGERILFLGRGPDAGGNGSKVDWWTAPVRGGTAHATGLTRYWTKFALNHLSINNWLIPAAWLPSQTLLFAAGHADSNNIWSLKIAPDGTPRGEPLRLTAGTSIEWRPAAVELAGRSFLTYQAMNADSDIWRISLDGNGHASGPPQPFVSGFAGMASSSLSRDGSRLVFSSRQQNVVGRQSIRMKDLKADRQSPVANVPSRHFVRPIISGDGQTVVYWADTTGYVIPASGGTAQVICGHCGPPTHISSDGRAALFEAATAPEQILYATAGSPPKPLIALDAPRFTMEFGARFSPDGRWIAFSAGNPSSTARRIFIAPFHPDRLVTPDELIPVTEGNFGDIEPTWAADGKTIFFISRRDGFLCIWARSLDAAARPRGPVYSISHFHHAGRALGEGLPYTGEIGLSAGPNFLVFSLTQSTSDIWLKTESAPAY